MLAIGTTAPDLVLHDQGGKPVALAELWASRHVVLFFYPRASSPVCTAEACAFRDAHADLETLDAVVVGISRDGAEAQSAFAQRWKLPFTLLSDVGGKAARAFDVGKFLGLMPGRVTYVIGRGGTVRAAHRDLLDAKGHVRAALAALEDQRSS